MPYPVDIDEELARLATPMCRYKMADLYCGERHPGLPTFKFEGRYLCDGHIKEIEETRTQLRRQYAPIDELLVMRDELIRDIEKLEARRAML